jgi:hypothetical protein
MYYISKISTSETNQLHSIILKKVINETTYVSAIGYGGGGVFEEFCGKFHWDEEKDGLAGCFSNFHDPDEWEKKSFELEIIDEPFELINEEDKKIISQITEEIWNEYLTYDEEADTRLIRKKYSDEIENDYTYSDDWDDDVVGFISNNFWGLSISFDW